MTTRGKYAGSRIQEGTRVQSEWTLGEWKCVIVYGFGAQSDGTLMDIEFESHLHKDSILSHVNEGDYLQETIIILKAS